MLPKIILTIAIPTYNRAEFIATAIESVISQIDSTVCDTVNILVCDNASSDNTENVCNQYKQKIVLKLSLQQILQTKLLIQNTKHLTKKQIWLNIEKTI